MECGRAARFVAAEWKFCNINKPIVCESTRILEVERKYIAMTLFNPFPKFKQNFTVLSVIYKRGQAMRPA